MMPVPPYLFLLTLIMVVSQNKVFDVAHMRTIYNFNLAITISVMTSMRYVCYQFIGIIQCAIFRIEPENNGPFLQFDIN